MSFSEILAIPNPSSNNVIIRYFLKYKVESVTINIHSASGQLIYSNSKAPTKDGQHEVEWKGFEQPGVSIANGLYFCTLIAKKEGHIDERIIKIVLMK